MVCFGFEPPLVAHPQMQYGIGERLIQLTTVNIDGLEIAAVFAALCNGSRPDYKSLFRFNGELVTIEDARAFVGNLPMSFDYIKGRVLGVRFVALDAIDTSKYDLVNGVGAAQLVINSLRQTGDVNSTFIQGVHAIGIEEATASIISEGEEYLRTLSASPIPA